MGRFVLCADKDVLLAKGEYIYFYVQARAPELSGAQQAPGSGASISSLKRAAFQLFNSSCQLLTCFAEVKQLKVGLYLRKEEDIFLQITDKRWTLRPDGKNYLLFTAKVLRDICISRSMDFSIYKQGYSLAWVTLSDKGSQGLREDKSGPLIAELVGKGIDISFECGFVLPDDIYELKALLTHLALFWGIDLILTTGGTGVAPRDITPEATLSVIEKRLPGFEQAMISCALTKTVHGMISRAVVGTLDESLIINLPGSPKAVQENLSAILPAILHTLKKLQGDKSDCGRI